MTLHIIHSNKVENLHDELCHLLKHKPLPNPFDVETIVCPSKAMAKWINNRFTQKMGIAAHYDYPMPSSWVWNLASSLLPDVPEQDPLQRELSSWQIFHLLEDQDDELFDVIKDYLDNDSDSTKRWSLSKKIALVFERYQHFRPELIKQWHKQKAEDWQGKLWQLLTQNFSTDRVHLLESLGQFIVNKRNDVNLPERIVFFSVSAMPPLLFKNIQALAQCTEVYFFVLSPSEHYWSDLVSLKQQARQRLKSPELNDYFTTGHELLASWGRQGQVFQDMLLYELDDSITEYYDPYDNNFGPHLLNQLQKSLFELSDEIAFVESDDSIRFNRCHSPLRECEVLHDQCLGLLEDDAISPEDILVIVPNMDQYAASIEAVFKKTIDQHKVKPFIPWNLSDSSLQAENPLIRTFLNVLTLPSSRFTASDILAFLDCTELMQRFNIAETDKTVIRDYINQAQVHWGFDSEHKADFNLPEILQNTWQQAQQRFFNSYAIDEQEMINDVPPLQGFSSSRATVISRFMLLLDTLFYWRKRLAYPRASAQWQNDLNHCLDDLFLSSEDGCLQLIRDAIDEHVIQSTQKNSQKHVKLHRELLQQWLSDYFDNSQGAQRYFTGGITFCGMRPMRSVPFKVIVMLGMNEHDFPRHNKPIEFDLMASKWQPGDLSLGDEDRYLFLEAILCAREYLIISYCANSLKDNAIKEPSHLVSELCDYLDSHFSTKQIKELSMSQQLSTQFAMHAFSVKNYTDNYQSYNKFWCQVAEKLNVDDVEDATDSGISYQQEDTVEANLKQLIICLKDPLKSYFNHQLKIKLFETADAEDDEPFSLNALQKWSLKQQLINDKLLQKKASLSHQKVQTSLPHGQYAQVCLDEIKSDLEDQFSGLENYLSQPSTSVKIEFNMNDGALLTGKVEHYYQGLGQLMISPSNFGAKPFIECWLNHCALCASKQLSEAENSVLRCKDKIINFNYVTQADALNILLDAKNIMQQALQMPLTVLPKCSFAYQYQLTINDGEKALQDTLLKWHGNPRNEASLGEKENDMVALTFKQFYAEPSRLFDSDDFKQMAHSLYATAFKHCHIEEEGKP